MIYKKRLKVKGPAIYLPPFQWKQHSSGLQFKVAYWSALAVGGLDQLQAAHCLNERT